MSETFLGILSLDTAFPRIIGDAGNPDSYPFDARVMVVEGADSPKIVRQGCIDPDLLAGFIAAAQHLERAGAAAIVSTCGFLINEQATVARAVGVPVILSALSMYSMVRASCPGRIGIVTASSAALDNGTLSAAGIEPDAVAIAGLESDRVFERTFLTGRQHQMHSIDRSAIERSVVTASRTLQKNHPDLSAILFECGNLPPYAAAVRQATALPVFHLLDAAALLMASAVASGSS